VGPGLETRPRRGTSGDRAVSCARIAAPIKTIKAIVVIVLLKVIMLIFDWYSPASSIFHRQFLFSLQLLVIVWLLLSLLLFILKKEKSWVARFLPALIVMVVLATDVLFSFWMGAPAKIPGFLKKEFTVDGTHLRKIAYPVWAEKVKAIIAKHKI